MFFSHFKLTIMVTISTLPPAEDEIIVTRYQIRLPHPSPTDGFAQPSGFGGTEQCSVKPRLRPLKGRLLIGSLRS